MPQAETLKTPDAEVAFFVSGDGPPVILLHPFPANHHFWDECLPFLEPKYKLLAPDLRGHGISGSGNSPVTMAKHASDLEALCARQAIRRAVFVGVSIGGYILFEFWRRHSDRIHALVLASTRASADSAEARKARLDSISAIQLRGPAQFVEGMLTRVLGASTRESRPDLVDAARSMMARATTAGLVAVQQGMADRQDSRALLPQITVPVLVLAGSEDALIPAHESQLMAGLMKSARLQIISRAGHYAAFEQPETFSRLLRAFLEGLPSW